MMEPYLQYLLRSSVWLTGFALVYILFLRNERYFLLNRIFLIAGILTAFIFPLITIRYTVTLPFFLTGNTSESAIGYNNGDGASLLERLSSGLIFVYVSGVLFIVFLILKQCRSVLKAVSKAEFLSEHSVKLIRSSRYESSFSFFSFVFVNPSVSDAEAREILNHEIVHVRQKHWFDLMLAELLCIIQWFNPVIWIYIRLIRQNHEFLADEGALQRTSDPAVYRAALLNQIVGTPVVLANSFAYSINKKRFEMMKNIISSPYRKLKVLLVLPVFAIILYSFAEPDYKYVTNEQSSFSENAQDGINLNNANGILSAGIAVLPQDAKSKVEKPTAPDSPQKATKSKSDPVAPPPPPPPPPLYVVDGKVSDKMYNPIANENIESMKVLKADLAVEKYGEKAKYGAIEITTKNQSGEDKGVIVVRRSETVPPPPPPPPGTGIKIRSVGDANGNKPLIAVDGKIVEGDLNFIDPNTIESVSVMKDASSTEKYGEKGKDGVVEITLKKGVQESSAGSMKSVRVVGYGEQKSEDPLQQIKIVGYGTQISGAPPVIYVDGVYKGTDINNIVPEDIDNLSVLKDESAVKLYGEKARNGVIIITTKKKVNK